MSLRNLLKTIVPLLILTAFIGLGIANIQADRELKLENKIELQSREAELLELNNKYESVLQQKTDTQKERDEQAKQIKELQEERQRLTEQLQAKKAREAAEERRLAEASNRATATQTARAEASVQSSGDCSLVNNYAWDKRIAYAVCMAESGGNSQASNYNDRHHNCVGSFGLMQLACFWIPNPLDPVANMDKAYEIYQRSGWKPWGAYTNGSYRSYL